jgi:mono/diheme cytochrome c family protein
MFETRGASRNPWKRPVVWIALIALLALACGSGDAPPPGDGDAAEVPKAAPAPPGPEPTSPEPVAQARTPDAVKGDAIYQTYCASCHGARGAGDGPVGKTLDPKPVKHDDGVYMNALTNDYLFQVIEEGGAAVGKSPLMAPWGGSLSEEQIWDVIAFVRSLATPPFDGSVP